MIRSGISISEPAWRVGVCRRTGMRWRHGRTITTADGRRRQYPSVVAGPVREISPRFLSEDERAAWDPIRGRVARSTSRSGRLHSGARPGERTGRPPRMEASRCRLRLNGRPHCSHRPARDSLNYDDQGKGTGASRALLCASWS